MNTPNSYYRHVLQRQNIIKTLLYDFFLKFASYPRLLLETFIRRNFGERYFSLAASITVLFVLALLPRIFYALPGFSLLGADYYGEKPSFWGEYGTWYAFLTAFAYFSIQRKKEVARSKSLFNFKKYSLFSGDIHPRFHQTRIFGNSPSIRAIETLYEPGLFFIIGIPLILLGQKLGYLLTVSSIFYALSYAAAYSSGDNYILDLSDELLTKRSLQTFIEGQLFDKETLVQFRFDPPTEREIREGLAIPMAGGNPHDEPVSHAE